MASFLLTWNPKKWTGWDEETLEKVAEDVLAGTAKGSWSTGSSRRLMPGDRVYWLRFGQVQRGKLAPDHLRCRCARIPRCHHFQS